MGVKYLKRQRNALNRVETVLEKEVTTVLYDDYIEDLCDEIAETYMIQIGWYV